MNLARLRRDFPALRRRGRERPPSYLDSACISLVPQATLDAMEEYYTEYPACAGRSSHRWSEAAGRGYEEARAAIARFAGAADPTGLVFLRNATEGINLVAQGISWEPGDRVLITGQEHNSNLIVWQRLAAERGIRIDALDLPSDGSFPSEQLEERLAHGIRLVSMFHTSNLDGRSLPIREIVERAHDHHALCLFDGAQSAPHRAIEFDRVGADFYAFSGHKMLGPTGTGMLLGRRERLNELRPLVLGGETVAWSRLDAHDLRPPPYRFEAGLQNYAGILGARAGIEYLARRGLPEVERGQRELNRFVTEALSDERRIHVLGPPGVADRPSIFGFTVDGIDPHDVALFLDAGHRVLVRSGMHCVHSWYDRRGIAGSVRASFYLYNDVADARALVRGLRELVEKVPNGSPGPAPARLGPRSKEL